ncbi:MAG: hypothetical protein FWC89_14270, partial [Defluviitaleaceae bacterium]|nr:hypothetical protein [Defluviitaleaceae bacterium]
MATLVRQESLRNNIVADHRAYTFTATGSIRTATNGTHTITKRYDAQGRLIRQDETGGIIKTFQYNAANNRTQSRVYVNNAVFQNNTYTYDVAQRLHTVRSNNELLATYTYDANSRVATVTTGNGVVTTYARNFAGTVTSVVNRRGTVTLSSISYSHYLDGNIQRRTENLNGVSRTITYTYDQARRLTRE